MSIESVMPSNHLILYCPLLLLPSIFPPSESFPVSLLFTSGGQSIGASASASVLSMNNQGWFPLGLISLISLLSKGLSSVFSSTTIWEHQFFSAQPSFGERNGNPLQYSCLENPEDGAAWWAAIYGVAQSQTRLRWLSSSSSNLLYGPALTFIHDYWKNHSFDYTDLCWQKDTYIYVCIRR